jgi:hypothetical protein
MFLLTTVTAMQVDGRQDRYRVVAAGALGTEQEESMTAAPPPMIRMVGVNKHFGSLQVLKDIDLEVDRGPTSGWCSSSSTSSRTRRSRRT